MGLILKRERVKTVRAHVLLCVTGAVTNRVGPPSRIDEAMIPSILNVLVGAFFVLLVGGPANAEPGRVVDVDVGAAVGGNLGGSYAGSSLGVAASVGVGKRTSPTFVMLARLRGSLHKQGYGEYWKASLGASGIYLMRQVWVSGELGLGFVSDDGAHCFSNSDGIFAHAALGVGIPMSDRFAFVGDGVVSTVGDVMFVGGVRLTWY